MAKDDYFMIIYLLLKYLYKQLKNGVRFCSISDVVDNARIPNINEAYFYSIIEDMKDEKLIDVIEEYSNYIHEENKKVITHIKITFSGVDYLQNNSLMKKIMNGTKEIVSIIK